MVQHFSRTINVGPRVFCGEIRGHRVFGDLPEDLGGDNTAMDPFEGMLVALGNCMGMVIALACEARGVEYAGMIIEVEATEIEEERRLDRFRLTVHMPLPAEEKTLRAIEAAQLLCRVSHTLQHGATVEVLVAPDA